MVDSKNAVMEAARQMIDRYGKDALHEIELRILELEYHERSAELELWRNIRERVAMLTEEPVAHPKH